RPWRKAATRAGSGGGEGFGCGRSGRIVLKRQGALVDVAARLAGGRGDRSDRLLQGRAHESVPQHIVNVLIAGNRYIGRCNHSDKLAASLAITSPMSGEFIQSAPSDVLVQFGELAADNGGTRAQPLRQECERSGYAGARLEQHDRCGQRGEFGDAIVPRRG